MPLFVVTFRHPNGRRINCGSLNAPTAADAVAAACSRNPSHPPGGFSARPDFGFSPWRHGGWYTNVRHPSGACGCVAKLQNGRWAIACDPRPPEDRPTFRTRDEAAQAEADLIASRPDLYVHPRYA